MSKSIQTEGAPSVDGAFLKIIGAHKNGAVITALSSALKQVTASVQETNKSGTVTLTMKIVPASKGDATTLVFLPRVKVQAPETEAPGSIFYVDADFNMVRDDPNQQTMAFKQVSTGNAAEMPLRRVDSETQTMKETI